MSWDFRPGIRVVCIKRIEVITGGRGPTKGRVYVIRDVRAFPAGTEVFTGKAVSRLRFPTIALELVEMPGLWWNHTSFRPVDESRLDQFRAHLNPITREVEPA